MKKHFLSTVLICTSLAAVAQDSTQPSKVPFEGMDSRWINGQNRQSSSPLTVTDKKGETILTASVLTDVYFNYNFARPKDNTQTISATTGRANEFTVNQVSIGIESNYKNVIGRLWLQTGNMLHTVQEADGSVTRGRNTGTGNLKFIREAVAGYHFDVAYGLNVEAGIFMSFVGLESYVLQDNWTYQHSMVSDFTPFYFQGARVQFFPSRNFKTELWLLNGWQAYNSWSKNVGVGSSNYYRPSENVQLIANVYYGNDTHVAEATRLSKVRRFHHDHSIVARYYSAPYSSGISQAAFSMNNHYGFQSGDGVKAKDNYMAGTALAHRVWFNKNKLALTLRGDYVTNPGGYMAFIPAAPTSAPNAYDKAIAAGKDLKMTQLSATVDLMPNDFITFRFEFAHRNANVPYFAGSGGTTSQTGFTSDPIDPNWLPDLVKTENRLIMAVNFRL